MTRDAGVKRVQDLVLQPLPRQLREEPLHGVHPQRRGQRRELEREVKMILESFANIDRLARRHVVEDDVDRSHRADPLGDMIDKGGKILLAAAPDHLTGSRGGTHTCGTGCGNFSKHSPSRTGRRFTGITPGNSNSPLSAMGRGRGGAASHHPPQSGITFAKHRQAASNSRPAMRT